MLNNSILETFKISTSYPFANYITRNYASATELGSPCFMITTGLEKKTEYGNWGNLSHLHL